MPGLLFFLSLRQLWLDLFLSVRKKYVMLRVDPESCRIRGRG